MERDLGTSRVERKLRRQREHMLSLSAGFLIFVGIPALFVAALYVVIFVWPYAVLLFPMVGVVIGLIGGWVSDTRGIPRRVMRPADMEDESPPPEGVTQFPSEHRGGRHDGA